MRGSLDLAERLLINRLQSIAAREGRVVTASRANDRALQITAHVGERRKGVRGLLGLQRPLLSGAVDLSQVIDASVHLRGGARPNEVRNRDRGQQTDDGDHDHDFHEREARFLICSALHLVSLSTVRREPNDRRVR